MKRRVMMKKDILEYSHLLWACALISVVMCVANATAAPARKTRANKIAFDPVTSKPVWVSSVAPGVDPMLTMAIQNVRVADASGAPLVVVPPRPQPRSPYMPPLSPGNLPPWAVLR
jgi:hypothetical protein